MLEQPSKCRPSMFTDTEGRSLDYLYFVAYYLCWSQWLNALIVLEDFLNVDGNLLLGMGDQMYPTFAFE